MAVPVLRRVFPFPATEDYTFKFDVSGTSKQIVHNELEIKLSSDTSQVVYKKRIQEFRYQHIVPSNTLVNGNQYVALIRTYDFNQVLIGESEPIFFYCFSLPVLQIPTIVDGEVGNQTVLFSGKYYQAEDEPLQHYQFILYDDNKNILDKSPEMFDANIQYEFGGLENRQTYFIELKVFTLNEMQHSTGLIEFTVRYIVPRFNTAVTVENIPDEASIKIECNILRILGWAENEPVEYIDGEMADLRDNSVWFDEGFSIKNNFTIQMWVKEIVDNSTFFTMYARDNSNIQLRYKNNKIYLYKKLNDEYITQMLIGEQEILPTVSDIIFICIKHIDGLFDFSYEIC